MSQDQIKKWLKDHPEQEYTAPQLQMFLGLGKSIYPNLKTMRENGEIQFKAVEDIGGGNRYTRYYYYNEMFNEVDFKRASPIEIYKSPFKREITEDPYEYFVKVEDCGRSLIKLLNIINMDINTWKSLIDGCKIKSRRNDFNKYPNKKKILELNSEIYKILGGLN